MTKLPTDNIVSTHAPAAGSPAAEFGNGDLAKNDGPDADTAADKDNSGAAGGFDAAGAGDAAVLVVEGTGWLLGGLVGLFEGL